MVQLCTLNCIDLKGIQTKKYSQFFQTSTGKPLWQVNIIFEQGKQQKYPKKSVSLRMPWDNLKNAIKRYYLVFIV